MGQVHHQVVFALFGLPRVPGAFFQRLAHLVHLLFHEVQLPGQLDILRLFVSQGVDPLADFIEIPGEARHAPIKNHAEQQHIARGHPKPLVVLENTPVEHLGLLPAGEMSENINHAVGKAVLENPIHKQGHEHPAHQQSGQRSQQHLEQDFALQSFKRIIQFYTPRPTRSLCTAGFPPNPAFFPGGGGYGP